MEITFTIHTRRCGSSVTSGWVQSKDRDLVPIAREQTVAVGGTTTGLGGGGEAAGLQNNVVEWTDIEKDVEGTCSGLFRGTATAFVGGGVIKWRQPQDKR
jgi:hypothetical protein